jgi:hypothetical protein
MLKRPEKWLFIGKSFFGLRYFFEQKTQRQFCWVSKGQHVSKQLSGVQEPFVIP